MTPEQKAWIERMSTNHPVRKHDSRTGHERKGGRNFIRPEIVMEWIALKKDGKTNLQIAVLYGVSKTTVGAHLRKTA